MKDRLAGKMARARLVLAWETFWRLAWPLPAWGALFAAVALLDLLPHLSPLWHGLALAIFVFGLPVLALRLRRFRWPTRTETQRRLEQDSDLPHRPLAMLDDRVITQDEAGLWQLQRRRALAVIERLRLKPPAPGLPARDPYGLRFAALLLLAIGIAVGRHDPFIRFGRALDAGLDGSAPPALLQLWITPPAYTGLSPQLLRDDQSDEEIRVPAGSKLLAELQGSERDARLFIDDRKIAFNRLDRLSQKLDAELTEGRSLEVKLGWHRLAHWKIAVIADQPPQIEFVTPPVALKGGKLRLNIAASDDYAVQSVGIVIERLDMKTDNSEVNLSISGNRKEIVIDQALDLAAHPWSGLTVGITPIAEDGAHQRGEGEAVTLTLPEREFRNPVARTIAEQRHRLVIAPDQRMGPIGVLGNIASRPDSFRHDVTVFLDLMVARSRLFRDQSPAAVPSVLDMLWAAALRVEEGEVQNARDAVDQAAQALADALDKGASDSELSRLTEDLNRAMQKLMESLAKQAAATPADPGSPPNGRSMTPEQLRAMLDRMSDLAHAGARQAAQQSLQALRDMLDQLTAGSQQGQQQMQQTMQALQALTEEQRALLDRSFRRSQQSNDGKSGASADRQTQQALRRRLEQLMPSMPAPALDQALQAMQQAEQALQSGKMGEAQDAEGQALNKLQEGARQAEEALSQMPGGEGGAGRDPLGRDLPGGRENDQGNDAIPSQSDLGKSRQILDELRRRASEAERPPAERDYLRRLLDKIY